MKVRFLFYRADIAGHFVGKVISFWTGLFPCNWGTPPYCHVEVWFPDVTGVFSAMSFLYSSATRGDKGSGVRFAYRDVVLKHPERWDVIECDVKRVDLETTLEWLDSQQGKKYDFLGILGFFWPKPLENPNRWYCSELCIRAAWMMDVVAYKWRRISPRRMSKVITRSDKKTKNFCLKIVMRILLLILLIGGCASQPRLKKVVKVDVVAEARKAENREIIMRDILQYLNDRAFLRMGLIYMPPE